MITLSSTLPTATHENAPGCNLANLQWRFNRVGRFAATPPGGAALFKVTGHR
jgi:hypothetical protein